jgi:hypothetical protein
MMTLEGVPLQRVSFESVSLQRVSLAQRMSLAERVAFAERMSPHVKVPFMMSRRRWIWASEN